MKTFAKIQGKHWIMVKKENALKIGSGWKSGSWPNSYVDKSTYNSL